MAVLFKEQQMAHRERTWTLSFITAPVGALPSAPPWARGHVTDMLWRWGLQGIAEPACLITSELVTNAVQAAERDGWYDALGKLYVLQVGLLSDHRQLVIQVFDHAPGWPVVRYPRDDDISGRGLLLIDSLADAWGAVEHDNGKQVWALVSKP